MSYLERSPPPSVKHTTLVISCQVLLLCYVFRNKDMQPIANSSIKSRAKLRTN